jgi:curli biogenesis system outer membrane secretion channel CsgG
MVMMTVRKAVLFAFVLTIAVSAVALAADKPVVAVQEFRNNTSAGWWYGGVGRELAGLLTNEMANTGNFKMVEREKLGAVLDEQDLAASGRVAKGTGPKLGKVTGAQYIIVATVSAYEEKTQGGGGGLSYRGVSVGGKKDDAYIAVDLRVIDTETGEVEFSRSVEARSGGYGFDVGFWKRGLGGNLAQYNNTPAGKAIRGVVLEITDYLSCAMVEQGNCMAEYNTKEKSRREKTKKSIKLD